MCRSEQTAGGEVVGGPELDDESRRTMQLLMRNAYGRVAGHVTLVCSCLGIALVWVVASLGAISLFPVKVVIGSLMVAQYLVWSRLFGPERTTRQYLHAEPIPA